MKEGEKNTDKRDVEKIIQGHLIEKPSMYLQYNEKIQQK